MNFRFMSLILIFGSSQTLSAELMVYRWTDKDNVVHFSQHQPIDDEYTHFLVSNQSKIISRSELVIRDVSSIDQTKIAQDSEKLLPATMDIADKCKESKENVSMLTNFDIVQYTDEKGNKQVLTKQQIQDQLAINQKRTEVYCTREDDK